MTLIKLKDKISFEVSESPVLFDANGKMMSSKTHKVIFKQETGESLSVMRNSYNVMLNAHFEESVAQMREISGFDLSGYSEFDSGRILIAHLKNNLEDFRIGGHKIDDYLLMGTSHDGRYPFFIGTTTELLRCQNQFSRMSKFEKVRHTKSAPKKREELLKSLELYFSLRRNVYNNLEKLTEIEIDQDLIFAAQDYIMLVDKQDRIDGTISTKKQNKIEILNSSMMGEIADIGMNAFALFQGVTHYTTHKLEQKERVFGNVLGNAAKLNERAYEFVTSLM